MLGSVVNPDVVDQRSAPLADGSDSRQGALIANTGIDYLRDVRTGDLVPGHTSTATLPKWCSGQINAAEGDDAP